LHDTALFIDGIFRWLVVDYYEVILVFIITIIIGTLFNKQNISEIGMWGVVTFFIYGSLTSNYSLSQSFSDVDLDGKYDVISEMSYVNVILIGFVLLFSLKYNPKGILPEVPNRPLRPENGGDSS
jgi:hypothetical protein